MFRKSNTGTAWAKLPVLLKHEFLCNVPRIQVSDLQFRKKKLILRNKNLALQIGYQISLSTCFYILGTVPMVHGGHRTIWLLSV